MQYHTHPHSLYGSGPGERFYGGREKTQSFRPKPVRPYVSVSYGIDSRVRGIGNSYNTLLKTILYYMGHMVQPSGLGM